MEKVLAIEIDDHGIAVLTLNRPDSLNALNTELMRELARGVARVAEDRDVRCVVLTGAGRAFTAGGDTKAIRRASEDAVRNRTDTPSSIDKRARWLRRSVEASRQLHEMSKPTIAMINGPCAGAGLSLAGACDFRFSARSAVFVPSFVSMGVPGDYGGSWLWTRILGPAKARQLYLLEQKRNAEEALGFGLVDAVYDDDKLREETMAIARRLAGLEPVGVAYAKDNLNAALTEGLSQSLDRESLNMMVARQVLNDKRRARRDAT